MQIQSFKCNVDVNDVVIRNSSQIPVRGSPSIRMAHTGKEKNSDLGEPLDKNNTARLSNKTTVGKGH